MPLNDYKRRRAPGPGVRVAVVFGGALACAFLLILAGGLWSSADIGPSGLVTAAQDRAARGSDDARFGPIAVVVRVTELRAGPGGRVLARIGPRTEFKSSRVLAVVERRDGWLRVLASELPNGRTAWVDARDTEAGIVRYGLRVDLSARRLTVLRNGRPVRRVRTAVGEQGTPTPTGRFAVTDKVPFSDRGSPYGCCALALTAHQPRTPSSWRGGDRIAIHATPARASIGRSITLGCMRVPDRDARWLMRYIPLGVQVSIRA